MLFDTTFFIDLEQELHAGIPGAAAEFLRKAKRVPKAVSTVTIGEFAVGASEADTRRMFRGYRPVAFGYETSIYAGRLQAALPFRMGENDLWIAATALRFGLPLVSNDAKAFPLVPKLRLYRY